MTQKNIIVHKYEMYKLVKDGKLIELKVSNFHFETYSS